MEERLEYIDYWVKALIDAFEEVGEHSKAIGFLLQHERKGLNQNTAKALSSIIDKTREALEDLDLDVCAMQQMLEEIRETANELAEVK